MASAGCGTAASGGKWVRIPSSESGVGGSMSMRPLDAPPSASMVEASSSRKERHIESVIELAEEARRILEQGPSGADPVLVLKGGDTKVFAELLDGRTVQEANSRRPRGKSSGL